MGNQINKEYDVENQIASGGPSFCWKIYPAIKKATLEKVSVFLFEKNSIQTTKQNKQQFIENLRNEVKNLLKLRHPQILQVQSQPIESKNEFAFITEPVYASLANLRGNYSNLDNVPTDLKEYQIDSLEIQYGLKEIGEALTFIHSVPTLIHLNLLPECIFITPSHHWKVAGFMYSINNQFKQSNLPYTYNLNNIWPNSKIHLNLQPHLLLSHH
ncbi:scy1-like protein [Anaeramoeba ignava]|uniref:Scy1-like protein n=1 Tax=Anaeramoeba ignava TaxID=1746090 RepID=A0A9Q0R6J5_ANAIG|nr:scy1-like protein [Anaeramoeba ignava]